MSIINEALVEFKNVLHNNKIQIAYKHIFKIFSNLSRIANADEAQIHVGSIYHGYLDMSYLPVTTIKLKEQGLKIAIVFDYSSFKFSIWLSAANKNIQKKTWQKIKNSKWNKCNILSSIENTDAIATKVVNEIDDYSDDINTANTIWNHTKILISDVEDFYYLSNK